MLLFSFYIMVHLIDKGLIIIQMECYKKKGGVTVNKKAKEWWIKEVGNIIQWIMFFNSDDDDDDAEVEFKVHFYPKLCVLCFVWKTIYYYVLWRRSSV